jgi:hypothetical protein
MRRLLIMSLALVVNIAVRDASAQSAAPPVELGLSVSSTLVPDGTGLQRGPRLVVNLDGRNAVQFTAGLQELSPWGDSAQRETDLYLAAFRRLVLAAGPVRVVATLGGGLERTVIAVPATTFGNPPVTFPSSRGVEVLPAFTTGAAVEVRVGSRAAIFLEPSFILTGRLGARLSGGLVVPIGSYPPRPGRLEPSVPWAKLDAGERAWVTTGDGREVDGEVVGRSAATLTLRTRTGMVSFTADDVRAIDTTDPIRNGTVLGAKIGSLGAVLPSVLVTLLLCTLEDGCGAGEVLWANGLLIGIGAGVGAATGALTDSLRERRVPLYRGRSTGVRLAPILSGDRLGGRAVIRW